MVLKFPYLKFPSEPNEAFPDRRHGRRPVIPIEVKYKNNKVSYFVLIDSGADFNIFHAEVGKELGIDIKKGKKLEFYGIVGDKEDAYFHDIVINIGGNDFQCYCGFSYRFDNSRMPYGVLGQRGFFDLFEVKMNYNKNRIELKF